MLSRRTVIRLGAAGALGLSSLEAASASAASAFTGSHFYTASPTDKRRAEALGYRDDTAASGPMWVFRNSVYWQGHRAIRLHRLHNAAFGDHLCTIGAAEAALAVRQGYADESKRDPIWTLAITDATDTTDVPTGVLKLLRLYNPRRHDHLLTTNPEEADAAVRQGGYRLEPEYPAPYVLTSPPEPSFPAARFYRLRRS